MGILKVPNFESPVSSSVYILVMHCPCCSIVKNRERLNDVSTYPGKVIIRRGTYLETVNFCTCCTEKLCWRAETLYGERDISTLLLSKLISGLLFYFLKYSSKYTTRSKIGGWGNLEQCLLKSAVCIVKDLCTANVDQDEYRVATKPLLVPLATRFCTKLILAKFSKLIFKT